VGLSWVVKDVLGRPYWNGHSIQDILWSLLQNYRLPNRGGRREGGREAEAYTRQPTPWTRPDITFGALPTGFTHLSSWPHICFEALAMKSFVPVSEEVSMSLLVSSRN